MARLAIVPAEERRPRAASDLVEAGREGTFTSDVLGATITQYFPGDEPVSLSEITFAPGAVIPAHAHTEDEVLVVTAGSLRMGSRVLNAGSAAYIPKETVYAFTAGDAGCTFLNFRPAATAGYLTRDEALARRRARGEAEA